VHIPPDFEAERRYAIDTLLGEMLGLRYTIIPDAKKARTTLRLENKKELIVADAFFSECDETKGYLFAKNIPETVDYLTHDTTFEADIPVIYGNAFVRVGNERIECGADIFASVFFMLTRWEEYVCQTRDAHGRFPAYASLAYRAGFLHRPVVNEYAEMLWTMLSRLGCKQKRKARRFELVLTHDVDVVDK
jgi:hypothetical protein